VGRVVVLGLLCAGRCIGLDGGFLGAAPAMALEVVGFGQREEGAGAGSKMV